MQAISECIGSALFFSRESSHVRGVLVVDALILSRRCDSLRRTGAKLFKIVSAAHSRPPTGTALTLNRYAICYTTAL